MSLEYFQIRKNSRQVLRIYRGPYEGLDITRIQVWYRKWDDDDYKPGKIVAFSSDLLPGLIEGLVAVSQIEPVVETEGRIVCNVQSVDLFAALRGLLKRHGKPLHWENVYKILSEEDPTLRVTKWTVYNELLGSPDVFEQVEEDVFAVKKQ